jgi:hypothetical protein
MRSLIVCIWLVLAPLAVTLPAGAQQSDDAASRHHIQVSQNAYDTFQTVLIKSFMHLVGTVGEDINKTRMIYTI